MCSNRTNKAKPEYMVIWHAVGNDPFPRHRTRTSDKRNYQRLENYHNRTYVTDVPLFWT